MPPRSDRRAVISFVRLAIGRCACGRWLHSTRPEPVSTTMPAATCTPGRARVEAPAARSGDVAPVPFLGVCGTTPADRSVSGSTRQTTTAAATTRATSKIASTARSGDTAGRRRRRRGPACIEYSGGRLVATDTPYNRGRDGQPATRPALGGHPAAHGRGRSAGREAWKAGGGGDAAGCAGGRACGGGGSRSGRSAGHGGAAAGTAAQPASGAERDRRDHSHQPGPRAAGWGCDRAGGRGGGGLLDARVRPGGGSSRLAARPPLRSAVEPDRRGGGAGREQQRGGCAAVPRGDGGRRRGVDQPRSADRDRRRVPDP